MLSWKAVDLGGLGAGQGILTPPTPCMCYMWECTEVWCVQNPRKAREGAGPGRGWAVCLTPAGPPLCVSAGPDGGGAGSQRRPL